MVYELGNLKQVDFKEVWKNENDFSSWLAKEENISILTDDLKIEEIHDILCEDSVGRFRSDLYGHISDDQFVIIENELGDSDHDHLGKLITYGAGKDASVMIMIVERALPEHRAAISWLNSNMPDKNFFLVELKVLKINDSLPAIHFDCVERPNEYIQIQKSNSPSEQARYEFWENLITYLSDQKEFMTKFRNVGNMNPTKERWISFHIGTSRVRFEVYLHSSNNRLTTVDCNTYIDKTEDFNHLLKNQEEIELKFEDDVEWISYEKQHAKRIHIPGPSVDTRDSKVTFEWIKNCLLTSNSIITEFLGIN